MPQPPAKYHGHLKGVIIVIAQMRKLGLRKLKGLAQSSLASESGQRQTWALDSVLGTDGRATLAGSWQQFMLSPSFPSMSPSGDVGPSKRRLLGLLLSHVFVHSVNLNRPSPSAWHVHLKLSQTQALRGLTAWEGFRGDWCGICDGRQGLRAWLCH